MMIFRLLCALLGVLRPSHAPQKTTRRWGFERIDVARDFSRYPGGRTRADGPDSAERFREEFLVPALRLAHMNEGTVEVRLDGTLGYAANFLQEAFGGLVTVEGFLHHDLLGMLCLQTKEHSVHSLIWRYIADAPQRASAVASIAPVRTVA